MKNLEFKIALSIISLIILFTILSNSNILRFDYTVGVSNGKPYCIFCPTITTNLKEPNEGDFVAYRKYEFNGSAFIYTLFNHKFVKKESDAFIVYSKEFRQYDYFPKDDFVGTVIFEWKLKTTDDFMESCLKELENSRIFDKIAECNSWRINTPLE